MQTFKSPKQLLAHNIYFFDPTIFFFGTQHHNNHIRQTTFDITKHHYVRKAFQFYSFLINHPYQDAFINMNILLY